MSVTDLGDGYYQIVVSDPTQDYTEMWEEFMKGYKTTTAVQGERVILADIDCLRMFEGLNRDYAALRSDGAAWEAEQAERRELDGTIADGLDEDDEREAGA